jgi:hypothetical protein
MSSLKGIAAESGLAIALADCANCLGTKLFADRFPLRDSLTKSVAVATSLPESNWNKAPTVGAPVEGVAVARKASRS